MSPVPKPPLQNAVLPAASRSRYEASTHFVDTPSSDCQRCVPRPEGLSPYLDTKDLSRNKGSVQARFPGAQPRRRTVDRGPR